MSDPSSPLRPSPFRFAAACLASFAAGVIVTSVLAGAPPAGASSPASAAALPAGAQASAPAAAIPAPTISQPDPPAGSAAAPAPVAGTPALATLGAAAVSAPRTGPAPRLVLDETKVDFGDMDQGTTRTHSFVFRNEGEGTLRIEDVTSTCGCTAALPALREVPPGGKSEIAITFRSGAFSGPIHKMVNVRSNDPSQPATVLHVHANVHPLFTFDPPALVLGDVARGKEVTREVVIRDAKGQALELESVTASHPDLTAVLVPRAESDDPKSRRIRVTLAARGSPGPLFANILVRPEAKDLPPATLSVRATIQGNVRVSPPALFLGQVSEGQSFPPQKLTVESLTADPIELRSVETGDPGIRATVTTITPGRKFEIALIVEKMPPPGRFERRLQIATSTSDPPLGVILSGVVRKAK